MTRTRDARTAAVACHALLVAVSLACGHIDDRDLRRADGRPDEWITHGRTYSEQRFSPLDQINAETVGRLGLAWTFDTGWNGPLEATPLVVDGVMYATGPGSRVFALDARTGRRLWVWDPYVPRWYRARSCCDVVNRGVAYYRGKVYVGVFDGYLAALDARTGEVVWNVLTVDQTKPYSITGAPRIVKGQVIIGNGGAEFGVRGYVTAYDAETGELRWRFYTVPGDPARGFESEAMERAARTWTGDAWWKMGGGGTAWDSMAYDPDLDLLYVGTGNGTPWNRALRSPGGGDNLYLASILALDPDDGRLEWYYQTTPAETWDYTATQHMILADLTIDGRVRQVLMQAPKNGFFYVLDRASGELISAEPYVRVTWAAGIDPKTGRPIESPDADYTSEAKVVRPGPHGGHNWPPMSFNPATGLVYVPIHEAARYYVPDEHFQYRPGTFNLGAAQIAPPLDRPADRGATGHLVAWDPVAQRPRWRIDHVQPWNGGTLTTAGNLVFQGTQEGTVAAFRADDGAKLWEAPVGTGIMAPPVTYQVDGVQYVTVLAGFGASYEMRFQNIGKVHTFVLGGEAPEMGRVEPPEVEPIPQKADRAAIDRGRRLFGTHCEQCHGDRTTIQDLRYSDADVFDDYRSILREGSRTTQGMPTFRDVLSDDDVSAVRAYVIEERRKIATARSEDEPREPADTSPESESLPTALQ